MAEFQFPPPRGGERDNPTTYAWFAGFQFPPPRGGERLGSCWHVHGVAISIPAPARGRTEWSQRCNQGEDFNSRPREGAN